MLTQPGERRVLLVEAPIESFFGDGADWAGLVERLLALGAQRVAFVTLPSLDAARLRPLLAHPRVDVGVRIEVDPVQAERSRLRVPGALHDLGFRAVVVTGESRLGVHRSMPFSVPVEGLELPTLQALVARQVGQELPAQAGAFRIGFLDGPPRQFPRASLQQVMGGELIPEAVRGRIALVGPVSTRFQGSVVTPLTTRTVSVSELEYHGYALDSLLRGRTLRTPGPWSEALLVAVTALATLLGMQRLQFRAGVAVALGGALGLLALAAVLLPAARLHLPVVGPLLALAAITVTVFQHKTRAQGRELGSLVTTTSLALASRWAPVAPREEQAFWAHLLGMMDQLLPLSRAVLLERVGSGQRLREVAALRCSMDDIAERRRDFQRPPYVDSLAHGMEFEPMGFLKGVAEDEQQLLLPLVADGRVLGFWISGLPRERLAARPTLHTAFEQVAGELAELLLERRGDRRQRGADASPAPAQDEVLQRLSFNLRAIDRHFSIMEAIFDGLRTPTVVHDTFGRTIAVNRSMKALLEQQAPHAAQAGAPALLESLCGMEPAAAREALASVAFEGHEFERTTHGPISRHLLRVTALRAQPSPAAADAPQRRPGAQGLVVELLPLGQEVPDARGGVDVWSLLDRAVARVVPLEDCDAVDFALDGTREVPRVAVSAQPFTEALTALLQLLALDSRCPGVVDVRVALEGSWVRIDMANTGYAMPPLALQAALEGTQLPPAGPLRQIRALRDSAFTGGRFTLQSQLGQGYQATVRMPVLD